MKMFLISLNAILFLMGHLAMAEGDDTYTVRTDRFDYKPGEKIRFSVKVADSYKFKDGWVALCGKDDCVAAYSLNLNEKTGMLEGELTVPQVLNTPSPTFHIYLEEKSGNTRRLESGKHFDAPVIRGAKIDTTAPIVTDVNVEPTANNAIRVSFNAKDADPKANASNVAIFVGSDCLDARGFQCDKNGKCVAEIPIPKVVGGIPTLDIRVRDAATNQTLLRSGKDFAVNWSKFKFNTDPRPITISSAKVTSCAGGQAIIEITTNGSKFKNGFSSIFSNDSVVSQSSLTCNDKGVCSVILKLPQVLSSGKPRVHVLVIGENGTENGLTLPEGSIDFSGIPVDSEVCKVKHIAIENPSLRHEETRQQDGTVVDHQ
jgi:hypothetical protein